MAALESYELREISANVWASGGLGAISPPEYRRRTMAPEWCPIGPGDCSAQFGDVNDERLDHSEDRVVRKAHEAAFRKVGSFQVLEDITRANIVEGEPGPELVGYTCIIVIACLAAGSRTLESRPLVEIIDAALGR
jgi:hypothetical protein